MDMLFSGLSNIIDLNDNTIEMLEKYRTADDFMNADQENLNRYVTRRKINRIKEVAQSSLQPGE